MAVVLVVRGTVNRSHSLQCTERVLVRRKRAFRICARACLGGAHRRECSAQSCAVLLDMAAEPQPDWLSCLPSSWSYGVVRDGRIFFINEQAQSTTWLHPVSGEAVVTGHRKTPDLPTGWEEGYTFEGARCFINHNERKVTCKHPLSGAPSQDNCIFVVNEQPAPKTSSEQSSTEKKERPTSTMSETSHYTGGSDLSTFPGSPATSTSTATAPCIAPGPTSAPTGPTSAPTAATRPSRSSKKLHNFGKRSNSIKRNLNAPVVKRGWLYKQDSTGMKLWKKRWFVLSDMCLFYYRDDKEDNVLGSILLPSFHISMLSVDDHISRKYAFKATHPNMRTYYFCSDTAKDMESWMKVMTDAALVHTEPFRRIDKLNADLKKSEELNNLQNHQALTCPEIQNNERNREPTRQPSCSRGDEKLPDYYTLHRDGERYLVKKDGVSYMLQKDGEKYILHKDGEQFLLRKNGEKFCLQKDEHCALHSDAQKNSTLKNHMRTVSLAEDKYGPVKDGPKLLPVKDSPTYAMHTLPAQHTDGHRYVPVKEVRRQLSLRETDRSSMFGNNKYGTIHVVDRYGTLKEVKKYSTLREGDRYATLKDVDKYATLREGDKYATLREGDKYGLHRDRSAERAKISIQLQPAQAAAIAAAVSASRQNQSKMNGSAPAAVDQSDSSSRLHLHTPALPTETAPKTTGLSRTNSMPPMEPWARSYRAKGDDDTTSITSYQTLPRNMPSHRTQIVPRFPEGYRTLPRNSLCRPESVCAVSAADKRRSIKDDTMWQLYEWQQRQAFSRLSLAPPTGAGHYGTLPTTKTMSHLCESVAPPIPTSPSHGSLYSTLSPPRQQVAPDPSSPHSELSSPVLRDSAHCRQKTLPLKLGYPAERYTATGLSPHNITPQSLQGKTSEELTLLLIKLRRQQAELSSLREHTLAQLRALGSEGPNAKTDVLSHHLQRSLRYLDSQKKENEPLIFMIHTMIENSAPRPQLYQHISPETLKNFVSDAEDPDIDTKLSRLCEQDKVVRTHEEKVQQLHREKHTLETALLSASQELSEHNLHSAASQNLLQQRDVLQGGLLSTCRELSRVTAELQLSRQEYERLEGDVSQAKSRLLQQLEALGSPQTEPPSQRHIQIQKELWRIQDVMEALAKNKSQPPADGLGGFPGSKPLSSISKSETVMLPLSPLKEGDPVPPRPPLPHHYPHPKGRSDDRTASSRNGAHSQAPDYRLYKSEPELTTVKEEETDEPHGEDRGGGEVAERRETPTTKVTPCPVGIVPPRTKCSMSPPESTTIASYVTLRKTKKTEPRAERPRSAMDQMGVGERELGRIRMSVEEQLERIRRNQEASTLRRSKLSRSASFNREQAPAPSTQQVQSWPQTEGACTDRCGLEAALQRLKDASVSLTEGGASLSEQEIQTAVEIKGECLKEGHEKGEKPLQFSDSDSPNAEECERRTAVILEFTAKPQQVEIVELQPFEDVGSSATNTPSDHSFQTTEPEMWSPEPREEQPHVTLTRESSRDTSQDSSSELKTEDSHLCKNSILPAQTLTLVSSDT